MAGDVLSQAELEVLLSSLEPLDAPNERDRPWSLASPGPVSPSRPVARSGEKLAIHDLRRPNGVSQERLRRLQSLHEGFARNFAIGLSAVLRSVVGVKLASLEELTYGEFVLKLEYPTCFNVVRATPLNCSLIVDIQPTILFPIIDRLLGGGRESGTIARRALTDIELRLTSRITGLVLQELRKVWQRTLELELTVERVESDPRLARIIPPDESMVRVRFELSIDDARGGLSLCIPRIAIDALEARLRFDGKSITGASVAKTDPVGAIGENLKRSVVELVVELAESKITTGDVFNLRVGDIITTEKDIHTPMSICLEGVPKFRGYAGAFKGHKAIEIDEPLAPAAPGDVQQTTATSIEAGPLPPG